VVFWPCATADLVIDTSALPAADLMRPLTGRFALDAVSLRVFVTSLARRHGTPGLPI
jgi:RNase adaptor protein for sRNA GlmZ degradation